jgi:drug/metabolite transporter (DMT)-like permease
VVLSLLRAGLGRICLSRKEGGHVTSAALLLVLGSASIHAYWNMIYKATTNKDAFALLKSVCSFALLTGPAIWGMHHLAPQPSLWPRAAISGVGYAAFFIFLSAGYRAGDFSLVYPITRGVGSMLTVIGGVLLLGERLKPMGAIGVGLVILAVTGLSALTSERSKEHGLHLAPTILGCMVGLAIATYSLNDKYVQLAADAPFADRIACSVTFLWFAVSVSCVLLVVYSLVIGQAKAIGPTWRESPGRVVGCSLLDTLSYTLYLLAMSLPGSKAAYVSPMRSTSVVIAALLGALVLRERHPVLRFCAAGVVLVGAFLVARAGA